MLDRPKLLHPSLLSPDYPIALPPIRSRGGPTRFAGFGYALVCITPGTGWQRPVA